MGKLTIIHKNPEQVDSLVIGSGHSIMAGYIPTPVEKEVFSENFYKWANTTPESISRFGFWGGDIDYNTYYPNLDKSELTPKDEEFIEPMFRLLSATIVSKNYNPTDFSYENVLKNSMKLLLGQTVNCDHETNIGNAIGSVSQVIWQDEYKDGKFTIPAGINGVLKIDGKANPRIARGILMEPPSIHSNSVTVQFKWDKSHPEMEDNEFYTKLGTYDSKGNMVRRIVTEVVRYMETSLVSHGADVFAQKIGNDGKIINPTYARRAWSSYSEYQEDTYKRYYFSDYKLTDNSINENNDTHATLINSDESNNTITNQIEMNELELFIQVITGAGMLQLAEGTEATKDNVTQALKDLISEANTLRDSNTNLSTEVQTLKEQVTNLNNQVANLTDKANIGINYIKSFREEVVNNYKKLHGDNVDEAIVNLINAETTGLTSLTSLNNSYKTQLEEKFPMVCAKCGSHDVSRASSQHVADTTVSNHEVDEDIDIDVYGSIYQRKINK